MSSGQLRLTKHHGAGNDFLVLLDSDDLRPLSPAEVRVLCDRRRGIGADGVLRVLSGRHGSALTMDLHNADGGLAEMSGNGIRCLVQAAVDAGWVAPGPVSVATAGGLRTVIYRAGDRPGLGFGSVDMGHATLGPELDAGALPAQLEPSVRFARTVDMGNPHIVLFGTPVDEATVTTAGGALEHSVRGRANVEFVWPGTGSDTLTMRVWERGVGETLACGTGACAAAAAAHGWGLVGSLVSVHSPGGTLQVELRPDGISLAGPTQRVGAVAVEDAVLAELAVIYDDETALASDGPAQNSVVRGP
ncbi:MAG TPA: diaminopimelate epimerase [Acidimicrobiales bacterium]|nr:diaminopimelate epimerase [Acidimicrobiales bacterium]